MTWCERGLFVLLGAAATCIGMLATRRPVIGVPPNARCIWYAPETTGRAPVIAK